MSDDNVKELPMSNESVQRLIVGAIEKYAAAMTPPSDAAEKQLWDQVVLYFVQTVGMDRDGSPIKGSVDDAVKKANAIVTERRKFFSSSNTN